MQSTDSPNPVGKPFYRGPRKPHKDGCACIVCSRNRAKKAKLESTGGGGETPKLDPKARAKKNKEAFVDASDPDQVIVVADKSKRGRIAHWALLRSQGKTNIEIAETLGISIRTLYSYIAKAAHEGWLKIDNPAERLEHVITPKVVDNIEHFIDNRDRTMTIEAAKGVGLFRSHQAVKVEHDAPPAMLALKIEVHGQPEKIIEGNIIGKPKYIDGDTE